MMKMIKRNRKLLLVLPVFLLLISLMSIGPQSVNATASLTASGDATVGVAYSVQIDGMTVGTTYAVVGQHSGGNVTALITATAATGYVTLTFTSTDSDGIVPVSVCTYAGALSADLDTIYVTLGNPSTGLPSAFFLLILPGLLIIAIVYKLVKNMTK